MASICWRSNSICSWLSAFSSATSKAEHHGTLRTVVGAPVGAIDFNIAIGIWLTNLATRLVAVGAQVAFATVEGHVFESEERHRIGGR